MYSVMLSIELGKSTGVLSLARNASIIEMACSIVRCRFFTLLFGVNLSFGAENAVTQHDSGGAMLSRSQNIKLFLMRRS